MVISIWFSMTFTIVLILLGIIFKKSPILTILLLVWMYILMAFNEGGPDIHNYYLMYSESSVMNSGHFFGPGQFWTAWNVFTKMHGMNFIQSHALIMVPTILIMFIGIRKMTKNVNFVLALMMIYPLPDMVIQRRQVIAMAVIIYALHFLMKKNLINHVYFIIAILVAYSFHEMSLLFLPLLIIPYLNVDHIFKTMIIFDLFSIIGIRILLQFAPMFFSQSKIDLYTTSLQISSIKTIPFVIIHFAFVLIAYYLEKQKINSNTNSPKDDFLIKLSIISTIYTPLYFTNTTFFRYFRAIVPGIFAFLANDQRDLKDRWKFLIIVVLSVIGFNLFFYILFGQIRFEGLILPIFRDNVLFNPAIYSY